MWWPSLLSVLLWSLGASEAIKDKVVVDHSYYEMTLYQHNKDNMFDTHHVDVTASGGKIHEFLSNHSQAAEAVAPAFDFPFYGHLVDRFFITTHGFLSFAPRLHNLMYKTQYIAPLRVKLDPSLSKYATINYLSQTDRLTIQWTNVTVMEPFQHPMGGNFTFQVTLFENGDVVFVYVMIPELLTSDALYDNEPVAGLSDAFLLGDNELHVYHTMNVPAPQINSKTVIIFKAKPTCIQQQSCEECITLRQNSDFKCSWCSKVHRCSDGADRLREHWNENLCPDQNSSSPDQCLVNPDGKHTEWRSSMLNKDIDSEGGEAADRGTDSGTIASIVISVVLVLILIGLALGFVYVYGIRNPGGIAEQIAHRLEANYKRFGGDLMPSGDERSSVELGKTKLQQQQSADIRNNNNNNNNNNNSITVNF